MCPIIGQLIIPEQVTLSLRELFPVACPVAVPVTVPDK